MKIPLAVKQRIHEADEEIRRLRAELKNNAAIAVASMKSITDLAIERDALRAELAAKSKEVERLDDGETRAIHERDRAYEIIDKLCDEVLGHERHEWSSAYYFEDAVDEVEDEVATLRKDAKRYRWLRDDAANGTRHDPAVLKDGPTDDCEFMFGGELDAAIDAAMGEGNGR